MKADRTAADGHGAAEDNLALPRIVAYTAPSPELIKNSERKTAAGIKVLMVGALDGGQTRRVGPRIGGVS